MRIPKSKHVFSMSKNHKPVESVPNKSNVVFETYDCCTNQLQTIADTMATIDRSKINPATGPVFIEDAQPGDVLAVTIQKIEIANRGVIITGADSGVLGSCFDDDYVTFIEIEDNVAKFLGLQLPLRKMIGVIGTAPAEEDISCSTPDEHGGNIDCTAITEGVTVYLPVAVEGALLSMGDLHACMGDGEIAGAGLEVAGAVSVYVEVLKNTSIPTPSIKSKTYFSTIASAENLDTAIFTATKKMAKYLTAATSLALQDSTMLLSLAGDLRICQVVNPQKTVRMELPVGYLDELVG